MCTLNFGTLNNSSEDFYEATLKPGINNREELFEELSIKLNFPVYFGNNWDALTDCLRDLDWIDEKDVILIHRDLPELDDKMLYTYIDILIFCIKDWEEGEQHTLTVTFPSDVQTRIENLISKINTP
ncbi:hypothetical protein BH09BAC1_BH09BAC1_05620 [soil metagenome]